MTDPTPNTTVSSFTTYMVAHQPPAEGLPSIILPVKEFLLIKACPPAWRVFDLYLVRDEQVVFYIGKSDLAFFRVWQHILDGYKGRSTIGRFILCNWRVSMNFTIELMCSRSGQFADPENDISTIERSLIQKYSPCFNLASNPQPTPMPEKYLPTTSPIQHARHLGKVIREAGYVLKREQRKGWLAELGEED